MTSVREKEPDTISGLLVGFGNDDDLYASDDPVAIESLEGASIVDIAFGGKHTVALSVKGEVFGFGANTDGQLGVDDMVDRSVPTPLKSFALLRMLHSKTIVQVVAGAEHSVAIDDSGTVYTWGAGRSGQLGYGISRSSSEAPLKQLTPRSVLPLHGVYIVQIASGGNHVLALADDGSVYSWGSGKNGRLGHGASQRDELRPKRISSLGQRALAVACGWSHSLAIAAPRTGMLARLFTRRPRTAPSAADDGALGAHEREQARSEQTAALYCWGRGADGRLGVGTPLVDVAEPAIVDSLCVRV